MFRVKNFILTKVDIKDKKLSKGHKKLARYITENYDKAAFMTASKLGEKVGVSESTVVRFATEMGFKGYPELQKELQQMIKSKLTAVQRMEVSSNLIGEQDAIKKVLNGDIELIRQTLEQISTDEFTKAVETINKAKRIYILGVRSSASLASFLYFLLLTPTKISPSLSCQYTVTSAMMLPTTQVKAKQTQKTWKSSLIIFIPYVPYPIHQQVL